MTRMSWLSSLGSMPRPADTAIAASRLNGACGEQPMLGASGALVFSRATSASPAASASAAAWPADRGPGLPEPATNASASSSGDALACHWSGCVVADNPGTAAASWDNIHVPGARPVARTPASAGTGSGGGDASSRAACPPQARPATTADTADCGSLPDRMAAWAGGAKATQANLGGGRTDPAPTATTRIPMARIKRLAPYPRNTSPEPGRALRAAAMTKVLLIPGGAAYLRSVLKGWRCCLRASSRRARWRARAPCHTRTSGSPRCPCACPGHSPR